ncbi:MAG: hypothetical protein RL637_735 [Pseudomonadota bacterium]|jgi:hypothetical protein
MEKITIPFVFGIGSQRAGSTFVSHLLNAIPKAYIHPLKEIHYFDSKYGIRHPQVLESFGRDRLALNIDSMSRYPGQGLLELLADQIVSDFKLIQNPYCDQHSYLYHFQSVLSRRQDISYLGESTPEYMLLPLAALTEIKSIVPNCKAVLIVRDPVKRFISAFRFLSAHEPFRHEGNEALSKRALQMLESEDRWVQQQDQFNQYQRAIDTFEAAGIPVFVIVNEQLQSNLNDIVKHLEQFLEINLNPLIVNQLQGKRINQVDFIFHPSSELIRALQQRYQAEEYQLPKATEFPSKLAKYIPQSWNPNGVTSSIR